MTVSVYEQIGSVLILRVKGSSGNAWYELANLSGHAIYGHHTWAKVANARKRAKTINRRIDSNTGN